MEKIKLGCTGLIVSRCGFGALPIQRAPMDEAVRILRKAYDNGIDFYDTARGYSDSEEKIGRALSRVRSKIVIATKSGAANRKDLLAQLETSLSNLKTDYIDILQLHNPQSLPDPRDPQSPYAGLLEARQKGMVRFLGLSNHSLDIATRAATSGLFDTVQFPLSSLSSDTDLSIIKVCKDRRVGLIAMKAIAGGLITDIASTFAFLRHYNNVLPIWGIQRESELDMFLELSAHPPRLTQKLWEVIRKDRKELGGKYCRGCGYCMPCPAGIPIAMAARMSFLLRRAPYQYFLGEEWRKNMLAIRDCKQCGQCTKQCPYHLDTPKILKFMLADYEKFYEEHRP
ncbi:MAG: aldo/keto reductase [Chitinivibrionales bacterium]|nr:aldo/keto reductase [Chitinivibrionales bacterium]